MTRPAAPHSAAPTPTRATSPRTARDLGIMQGFPPPPEKRPSKENWDLAPFNRWSFQNMRTLFPTVDVWRGTGAARALPSAHQDITDLAFNAATQNDAPQSIKQWLTASYTDGFLVMKQGKVVFEHYANDMGLRTPHLSQSVAKSLVGTLTGILHDEGLFKLDVPLTTFVPELAQCGYGDATLAQVLDMRSGVRFTEDYGLPGSDMTRIDIATGWRPPFPGEAVPTIRDVILALPAERPHGQAFKYRSIETDLIAWVLERTTGEPLAALLSDKIWSRIGADCDGFFTVDGAGTALADGGFNASLRDYARFGLMMLEDGAVDGAQIVPESWVRASATGDASAFGAPYTNASPNGAYSRQWWIQDVDRGDFMARGVFGQLIYLDPKTQFMAVKMSTWPDYLIESYTLDTIRAVTTIRDSLEA
ncbi:serine hydrolase [Roseovarius aestuarii]|nr:serine hydrolase [Roseovarius aestuarii]